MLRSLALSDNNTLETTHNVSNNCKKRIKPTMLSGVKTEALLVFARTALERFFQQIDEKNTYLLSELKKRLNMSTVHSET